MLDEKKVLLQRNTLRWSWSCKLVRKQSWYTGACTTYGSRRSTLTTRHHSPDESRHRQTICIDKKPGVEAQLQTPTSQITTLERLHSHRTSLRPPRQRQPCRNQLSPVWPRYRSCNASATGPGVSRGRIVHCAGNTEATRLKYILKELKELYKIV
jgi:hypothetical protein